MAKINKSLGQLELEVLKIIWQHSSCTVNHVAEVMSKRRQLAPTTVLTVIQRLYAKKFLKRRKLQGIYQYSPTAEQNSTMSHLIDQFVDEVLDGSPLPFVSFLAQSDKLTDEEIRVLQNITRKLDQPCQEEKS